MDLRPPRTTRRRRGRPRVRLASGLAIALVAFALPAAAQQQGELSDVFGGLGTAEVDEGDRGGLAPDLAPDEGTIAGQVIDAESGLGVPAVTVILIWPPTADGSEPRQEVQVTNAAGDYRFPRVPEGGYRLSFVKSGYRVSEMRSFSVVAGQVNVADFPLPPKAVDTAGEVLDLEAFVVEAATVTDMMSSIELKMESDALVDVMGVEDLSKFAASDVADALKRVSGVNVVEGRFAVIRGLEDRYSATTFNQAPVPSADPLRQSVQLDLFPADIVSGIVVQKTFEAISPGNAGAGSIDIGTMGYPDDLSIRISAGTGFNENAVDSFLEYRENSPIAKENGGTSVIESDINLSLGGRRDFWKREFRAKFVFAREIDYDTALGVIEGMEPRLPEFRTDRFGNITRVDATGSLPFARLEVTDGRFDWELSRRTEQLTYFGAFGMDIDREGDHRVDFTAFHTTKDLEAVDRRENGFVPGFDYEAVRNFEWTQSTLFSAGEHDAFLTVGSMLNKFREEVEKEGRDPLAFYPMVRGQSLVQDRELSIYQLNGEHDLARWVEGLTFDWAFNYANTKQDETAFRMRYWFGANEIDDGDLPVPPAFPPQPEDFAHLEGASWRTWQDDILYLENAIDERQLFGRGDLAYEIEPTRWLGTRGRAGFWYESSERGLEFIEYLRTNPDRDGPGVVNGNYVEGPGEAELGTNVYYAFGFDDLGEPGTSDFSREIIAGYFDLKLTFWEDVDVIGGVRLEQIQIISDNRPFTGDCANPRGSPGGILDPTKSGLGCPDGYLPKIFPSRYLYLDRLDNRQNPFFFEDPRFVSSGVSNDLVLGLDLPEDANGFVDLLTSDEVIDRLSGEIDEFAVFPMASVAYRPLEGLTLRGAYSQTAARPSFRELAYYASIVPGVPDRIVGNPFLQLSYVESFDTRLEYFWGDVGDLFAFSFFYKTIDNPIELVRLIDYSVFDFPLFEGPFRVYRNNENEAELLGIELETKISFGVLGMLGDNRFLDSSFLDYFSIGGNYTWIDASVPRSEFEINQAEVYFLATDEDIASGNVLLTGLPERRRLFNQPEWTANANFSFDHPDWGTRFTLSFFAISDVLNAAGSNDLDRAGLPVGLVLDEYTARFYQLDTVFSQSFSIPRTPGRWTARVSIKNLTDSTRGIVYDPDITDSRYYERRFTVGRDYTFSLQYQLTF